MQDLADKVVVVTGASRGIGAAVARAFARENCRLVLCGRDEKALKHVAGTLDLPDDNVIGVIADITRAAGMKKIVESAYKRFEAVDIFVNNAGIGDRRPLVETDEDTFDLIINTNLKAVYFSFRELIPRMTEAGRGHIINVSSLAAKNGVPGMAIYAASKAALNTLCESVGAEVRADNVKISVVSPGSVNTGFGGKEPVERVKADAPGPLTPEQVADTVVFVAKQDHNAWVSSTEIRMLRKS